MNKNKKIKIIKHFIMGTMFVAICPNCKQEPASAENRFPDRCSQCGQLLDWDGVRLD